MPSELEQEMLNADEKVTDDEWYAYVIITANGMGTDHYYADKCAHCEEEIEWDYVDYSDTPGWVHVDTQQALCDEYEGNDPPQAEPREVKRHNIVWETIPDVVKPALQKTDDTDYGIDVSETYEVETKWCGWLNREQWESLKDTWGLNPESSTATMGMITEYGGMWALAETHDGMDWNMGGLTPVDYVDIWYCSQDEDVMRVATEYGYFRKEET